MSSAPVTAAQQPPTGQLPWWQFSLGELMFFMAMAAVCSALWKVNLTLGIVALVVFMPTTLHTLRARRTCRRLEIPLLFADHTWNFLFSWLISGIAVGMYIACIVVLVVPCTIINLVILVLSTSPTASPFSDPAWLFIPAALIALPIPFKVFNHFKLRAALTELTVQQPPETE